MIVGVIKFSLHLPANQSLKGKRKVVKSLCQKIRNHFEVAVGEVEHNDHLKSAVIGISLVSNDGQIIQKVISQILSFIQGSAADFILQDFHQEILTGF